MSRVKSNSYYDGKIAGLYDLGDTLGRGHFAVVKLAKHVFTGEQVAVKVIDKSKLDEVSRAHLFQEVRCMKLVQHPNVVRLYDVIDTQTKLYLILELGDGGDMYDYIIKHDNGVDEETAKKYFRQIVYAISYCHKLHVVHRDLKPENVVFFEKLGMVKLTDFGFSNKFCPGQKLETSCGSLAYSAPEILLGDSYDAPKVDVWSLGVILYMLVCGRAPFQEANDSETLTMIMDCKYIVPHHISSDCCRLIGGMLIRDPEKRFTLEEITNDPWLNAGDVIQPADYLPLVSREHLSEEDHAHIIQKMVNGTIAAKEEILEALDKNEYNHITATYFLLAERKLRAQRQERAQMINSRMSRADLSPIAVTPSVSSAVPSPAQEKPNTSVESLVSPCLLSKPLEVRNFGSHLIPPNVTSALTPSVSEPFAVTPSMPLHRKCSIVKEEEDNYSTTSTSSSPTKSPICENKNIEEHLNQKSEGNLFKDAQKLDSEVITVSPSRRPIFSLPVVNNVKTLGSYSSRTNTSISKQYVTSQTISSHKQKSLPPHGRRLHSVQSSPQLPLNEINEDDSEQTLYRHGTPKKKNYSSKFHSHSSVISHVMLKVIEQNKVGKPKFVHCGQLDVKLNDIESDKLNSAKQLTSEGLVGDDWMPRGKCKVIRKDGKEEDEKRTQVSKGNPACSSMNVLPLECKPEDYKSLKNSPFGHAVFSADSTDSLDFLSDNQPRLINSMSCGDLSAADVGYFVLPEKAVVHSDSISLTEIPQALGIDIEDIEKLKIKNCVEPISTKYLCPISNSLSLNSGLSSMQKKKKNLKDNVHSSQPDTKANDKTSHGLGLGFGKLVSSGSRSASKHQLDINQNGWKKPESKKNLNRSGNSSNAANQQAVVDMKLASKCCTLC